MNERNLILGNYFTYYHKILFHSVSHFKYKIDLVFFLLHSICSVTTCGMLIFTLYFISLPVQFGKENLINKSNKDIVLDLLGHPLLTTTIRSII